MNSRSASCVPLNAAACAKAQSNHHLESSLGKNMVTSNQDREISDASLLVSDPLVSVHMLAYRHGPFIGRAIESVLAQICDFDFELIIAEDSSPDDTLDIAMSYQRLHPRRIRILTGPNIGMGGNALRANRAIRGRFTAFCEGDDFWTDPTKLARQASLLSTRPECSLVFHGSEVVDALTEVPLAKIRRSFQSRTFSTPEVIRGDGGLMPSASIMIRSEIFLTDAAWIRESPVGDYAIALVAALKGTVVYVNRTMSSYRTNVPHSWTRRHTNQFDYRTKHAEQIDSMLTQYAKESTSAAGASTREIISKYYSDVIVNVPGTISARGALLSRVSSKLTVSDLLLSWLAVNGLRLPTVKLSIRKLRTLLRLILSETAHAVRKLAISR